ncbi:MAG: MinD/ParA family protein [Nitrospirae bacterium]|nr:MinD/ParA family protein [Nitrospirota bacterium]
MRINSAGRKPVQTIAVASGKGGVGKTNVVANLAIAFRKMGKEVLVLDADLGLSNIDVLLDLAPRYNIRHVLNGERQMKDVIVKGPHGIKILPASSGVQEITSLDEFQRLRLLEQFDSYEDDIDILLIDTAAGISTNVAFFCIASQEIVIVTSPEPTAMTDAYALIKVLFTSYQEKKFKVLVNSVRSSDEAVRIFRKLSLAAERFLNISLDYLGYISLDNSIQKAVMAQKAFIEMYPDSVASKNLMDIALQLNNEKKDNIKGTLQFFLGNLLSRKGEDIHV